MQALQESRNKWLHKMQTVPVLVAPGRPLGSEAPRHAGCARCAYINPAGFGAAHRAEARLEYVLAQQDVEMGQQVSRDAEKQVPMLNDARWIIT